MKTRSETHLQDKDAAHQSPGELGPEPEVEVLVHGDHVQFVQDRDPHFGGDDDDNLGGREIRMLRAVWANLNLWQN
jgi:hypothetical protein